MEKLMKDIKGSPLVICKYKSGTFIFFFLMMIALSILSVYITYACVKEGEAYAASFSVIFVFMCFAGAAAFFLAIKNYTVIFHTEGLVIRTIMGKVYSYTYEQIEYYRIVNNPVDPAKSFFSLKTIDNHFQFNTFCTNYHKAIEVLVNSKIPYRE